MAKNTEKRYGSAVYDKYVDRATQVQSKYGLDPWTQQQKSLNAQQTDFNNYLSSGNYSVDNNKKYRDMATQAVADLDTQMKRYGTNSNEYKTLKGYKTYYENALPTFDRLDVGANVQDYLSYDQDKGFTNWHSQDDYNTQKSYLDQQRQAVQTELDGIEDQNSVDYQNLKSWQDQLDMYANALEERNNWDKQFEDVNDYTAYERAGDYKNSIQAKQTLKDAQDQLKETEARLKAMQMKFAAVTDLSTLDGADAQEYQDFINLQQDYKQLQENVTNAAAEVAGLEKWQKNTATYNLLSQYGEDADYEQILNDLRAAREKAQEGTEDWAKIDLQIRAIAGENEDGLNENGQYDDSTLLGRSIMRDFDVDAAQKRLDEIDQELKNLGVSTSRFWGGVTNADNAFGVDAAGMVYTDENAVGESDPRVMALRQEKTELTRKMNSAEKFQEKDAAETAFKNLSDEDHAALQEEGLKHITDKGDGKRFYRDGGFDPTQSSGMLENFQYLTDEQLEHLDKDWEKEQGKAIRNMIVEAVGAEALGKDIGYTVDDILRLYQGDINRLSGEIDAKKISAMDSDFARWNRQVLGVGTQAGLNQFVTGIRQAFSDDYIEPNKTSYKAQYTREDLKRYGDENFINGSNVSQVLFDTTQTTANMLPMIAASYLLTKAGAAPIVGELVGAGLMGVSSGGNTYQQALSEGWDKTDAKAYATILGAAEGTMQYLIGGIGRLGGVTEEGILKAAQGINNAAVRYVAETGVHIFSETTEELLQNRLDSLLRHELVGEDFQWWTDEDWYTVLVTALSTGAMEGAPGGLRAMSATRLGNQLSGNVIPSKGATQKQQANNAMIAAIGKQMQSSEALAYTLKTAALSMDENTEAHELASRMDSHKAADSAWNLGNLYRLILEENKQSGVPIESTMGGIIAGAVKYNGIETAKADVKAKEEALEVKRQNPGAVVLSGIATTLQKDFSAPALDSVDVASAIEKASNGDKLTASEMALLTGDSTASMAGRAYLAREYGVEIRADSSEKRARGAVESFIEQRSNLKAQEANMVRDAVAAAFTEGVDKTRVRNAAAMADRDAVPQRAAATDVEELRSAERDLSLAQQRLDAISNMSFDEIAQIGDTELADMFGETDAKVLLDLAERQKLIKGRMDRLSEIKLPAKEQRTELADYRREYAENDKKIEQIKNQKKAELEQAKKEAEANKTAEAPAASAQNSSAETIVHGGARMTRDAFVQDFSDRLMKSNPNITQEQAIERANQRFNELAAQVKPPEQTAGQTKAEEKPTEKRKPKRAKLTGKVEYWQGGALEGTEYDSTSVEEATRLLGETEMEFVNKVLSKVANVTLIKSQLVDGKYVGANGIFYKDGRIYLDVNAGLSGEKNGVSVGQRSVVLAAAHELTHYIREFNGDAYDKLRGFIENELKRQGVDFEALVKTEQDNYRAGTDGSKELSRDKAIEEVIANSCETMLTDADQIRRFAAESPAEAKTILDWLSDFFQKITDAFSELKSDRVEVAALQDKIGSIREMWLNALVEASENAERSSIDDTVQTEVNAKGEDVATTSDNGSGVFSLRTYRESGRTALEKFLKTRVKNDGLDQKQADEMLSQMDKFYEVCEAYDDGTYAPFSAWSNATVTEVDGKPVFSVVKKNGEYKLNLDFSLVCKKRRALDAVFNEMIERGLMNRIVGDEAFLKMHPASIAQINNFIREAGFETACALCFVDTKRYRQAMMADQFVASYNDLVNSLTEGTDKKATYFNYGGDRGFLNQFGNRSGIETLEDWDLNWSHVDEVLKNEKKGSALWKMANYIKNNPKGRQLAARGDFMSTNGMEALKINHPEILGLFHAQQGQGQAKDVEGDVQYLNEVIRSKSFNKEAAYAVGGVRIQSFSDYVGRLVFDYIQMAGDLAAKELPAHSYTKEYQFAMQFGKTGIKINMSLVPAVVEDGVAPGLDKDGNYAWKDGQSFGSTVYDNNGKRMTAAEGFQLAIQIQEADGYSRNCGTIAVGVSDAHIRKMLDDPNIRMIIPYHKSGINHLLAEMQQIGKYEDYTAYQNTRKKNAKGEWVKLGDNDADFNWNDTLQRLEREGKGAREAAEEYKAWCAARGYQPKFAQFAYHPNYYKVLEDFTAYDKDGTTPAPLGPVRLNFPQEGDAFGSMQDLIKAGLEEDALLQAKMDSGVGQIVDRIEKELPEWERQFEERGDRFAIQTSRESMAKTEMRDATQNPTESQQAMYSSRDNLGYHAGDLGKAEHLNIQGRSRGTGHFGTGTYFVGEEEKVTKDSHYGKRPQHAVDFSDYNLYKVRNDRDGYRLHDALKIIDGGINREWIAPAVKGDFNIINPTGYYDLARSKYGEEWALDDNLLNARLEYAKENGIDLQSWEEYKADKGEGLDEEGLEDLKYYYEDYVEETLKKKIEAVNDDYQEFRDAVFNLNLLTGLKDAKILSALQAVADYQDATPRLSKSDSYATVFMKNMGYDGVDVRSTGLDNTAYGSVIYDVKPETVAYSSRNANKPDNLKDDLLNIIMNGTAEDVSRYVTEQMNANEDKLENAKMRPPVIPSKGFVPRVTPREKEALETRRKGLIQEKGAMRPSEKSNGFAMPKQDEKGNWFHRFLQNAGSAKELKVAQDQVEKFAFTDVAGTYVPSSNKADLNWAKKAISEDGMESAIKQFNRAAVAMDNSRTDITKNLALGQQLLIETSRQGDMQNFLDVLSSLTLLSSQAGKSLQAFRMLKQSGPIGELYYVQKAVKQLNERHAGKITAGKMQTITVPEDLANEVLMATNEEEQDKAMDNLIAEIAKQVPVTLMDKWNAWRYLAMLGNARTHIRNVFGNAIFVPLRFAKDFMAAGGELLATKVGLMDEADRRKALFVPRELRDFAKQDAEAMQKELQGTGKYNPAREILDARRILPGFLENLSRKNGDLLEFEDWLFLSPAYQNSLAQALTHTGYSIDEMLDGSNQDAVRALNEARRIAIEEAQKATYRDFNAAASMLNRIKRMETGRASDKFFGVLLEGILPFTKTPINILRRGVEYSPIGIASSIFEAAAKVKSGEFDAAEFIDHLSAGLSGTAVVVLGYLLASLGYIRNKKDDKEEEFDKLQGYQDYSLQIGKVSATIDWAAPTALPLFTGAAAYDMIQRDESLEWKDAWDAMMMIAEPMMSLSMLDGLNNVLSAASYADDSDKLATTMSSAFTSYIGQAFPTLLGQLARSIDGTRRSTYVDKNSPVPSAIQRFVQSSVQSKTPIWESQKVPYIDQWGREDTVKSKAAGALENFFSPSYINIVHTTDVDEALQELYNSTKDSDVLPAGIKNRVTKVNGEERYLTADQFVDMAKYVGSTKYQLLTSLFADPRYMNLTDAQKAKAVSKVYTYANTTGKYYIWNDYDLHGQGKWMEEMYNMPTDAQRFNRFWEYLEESLKLDE